MEYRRSSETAVLAAMLRAAHLLLDEAPWILRDEFAGRFIGFETADSLLLTLRTVEDGLRRRFKADVVDVWMQSTRAYMALRSRFAEDELADAIARGVSQYVILGSGFDSFAYRRRDLEGSLLIYEVDHPATQDRKKTRIRELGIRTPSHLTLVSVDFEQDILLERLRASGYSMEKPAFFSLLGVISYLSEEAIFRTLSQIARSTAGSEVVLNYMVPVGMLSHEHDREVVGMTEAITAERGEPLRSYFRPDRLLALVRDAGFNQVRDIGAQEINARYVSDRSDGLRFTERMRLLRARVAREASARDEYVGGIGSAASIA